MGLPYIKRGDDPVFDYTGVIGISGSRRGGVYYTADRKLLEEFGKSMPEEADLDEAAFGDMVGEMANTTASPQWFSGCSDSALCSA
jgi:chemotaxis protein CheX